MQIALIFRLGTPLVMDQFGWSESDAILYLGIMMTVGGIVCVVAFVSVGPLARRFLTNNIPITHSNFSTIISDLTRGNF